MLVRTRCVAMSSALCTSLSLVSNNDIYTGTPADGDYYNANNITDCWWIERASGLECASYYMPESDGLYYRCESSSGSTRCLKDPSVSFTCLSPRPPSPPPPTPSPPPPAPLLPPVPDSPKTIRQLMRRRRLGTKKRPITIDPITGLRTDIQTSPISPIRSDIRFEATVNGDAADLDESLAVQHLAGKLGIDASQIVLDRKITTWEAPSGDVKALQSEVQLLRQQLAALNASRRLEVGWLLAALGCICCYLVVRFAPFGRGA